MVWPLLPIHHVLSTLDLSACSLGGVRYEEEEEGGCGAFLICCSDIIIYHQMISSAIWLFKNGSLLSRCLVFEYKVLGLIMTLIKVKIKLVLDSTNLLNGYDINFGLDYRTI